MPIRPIFSSLSKKTSFRPSFFARQSFTPPSAASRFVCMQMAEMSFLTSVVKTPPRRVSGRRVCISRSCQRTFITGWWDTMSCAPQSMASCTTRSVISSATKMRSTSCSGSPTRWPTLSQSIALSRGAQEKSLCSISCTVAMFPLPFSSLDLFDEIFKMRDTRLLICERRDGEAVSRPIELYKMLRQVFAVQRVGPQQ